MAKSKAPKQANYPSTPNKSQVGNLTPGHMDMMPDGDMRDVSNPSAHSFGAGRISVPGKPKKNAPKPPAATGFGKQSKASK